MGSFLAIHVLLQVWHFRWEELPWLLRQLFDVDVEQNLPTWYSAAALLLASALLLLLAGQKRSERDPWFLHWYGLSLGFALLSLDEVAGLHETLNSIVDYSWAIPGGIAAGLCGLAYARFLLHLPLRTRCLFLIAGAAFVAGALGVEMGTDWYDDADLLNTLPYNLWTAVEEGLEMAGVVLFIYALLAYMSRDDRAEVDVTVGVRRSTETPIQA